MTLILALVAGVPAPAEGALAGVGPERALTRITSHPAAAGAFAVAGSGDLAYAIWADPRGPYHLGRVRPDGTVLDPVGIRSPIYPGTSQPPRPAIGVLGDVALAAVRAGSGIEAVRLRADGTMLDVTPLRLLSDVNALPVAVTALADGFLFAWRKDDALRAARVRPDGSVVDAGGFVVATDRAEAAMASDGNRATLVRQTVDQLRVSQVHADGHVSDVAVVPVGHPAGRGPSIAWDGTGYTVAYAVRPGGLSSAAVEVRVLRLGPDGTLRSGPVRVTEIATFDFVPTSVASASHGASAVVWHNPRDRSNHALTFGADGAATSPPFGLPQDDLSGYPHLVSSGGRYLAAYGVCCTAALAAARFTPDGEVLDDEPFYVSLESPPQRAPAAATDGTNHLAVWQETRNGRPGIYGARVDGAGVSLDPDGIQISGKRGYEISVAWGGGVYLVVWNDESETFGGILGVRVSAAGDVLDDPPLEITKPYDAIKTPYDDAVGFPTVGSSGTGFLVAWVAYATPGNDDGVMSVPVSASGEVLGSPSELSAPGYWRNDSPAIGWNGSRYLVAWTAELRSPISVRTPELYVRTVGRDGVPASPIAAPGAVRTNMLSDWKRTPSVASDGDRFLVAVEAIAADSSSSSVDYVDVYGVLLDGNGNQGLNEPFVVGGGPQLQGSPKASWDGQRWLVVWQDERWPSTGTTRDIFATRVSSSGSVSTTLPVATAAEHELEPTISSLASGSVVFYVRNAAESGNHRVFARTVNLEPA